MAVWRRKGRQEGERLAAPAAQAAANADPLMALIVRLLAAAAMTNDGILRANRAMAQDDLHAGISPIGFEVELRRREWDKQNRSDEGPARPGHLARIDRPARGPSSYTNLAWKKNNAALPPVWGKAHWGWRQKVRRLSPDWPVNPRIFAIS